MNRQERLRFCNACSYQKFDTDKGIVCSITNAAAAFEVACTMYKENSELKHKMDMEAIRNQMFTQEADKKTRAINYLVDTVCVYLFMFIVTFVMGIVVAIVYPSAINIFQNIEDNAWLSYLIVFTSAMGYYILFEATAGRTVGKMLTKTKVVDCNGNKPDFSTILLRSLCRFVPFNPISFLFALDGGWHDQWSKTKVVVTG